MTQKTPKAPSAAETEIRSIPRTCRGPLKPDVRAEVVAALEKGNTERAKALDARGRPGCGADFNDIIVAGPHDGKEHGYRCPKCGVTGTYRAPLFSAEGAS